MSDRIAIMNLGKLEQLGTPRDVYRFPRTPFVANFIGKINLLPGRVSGREQNDLIVETAIGRFHAARPDIDGAASITLGVRPEHVTVVASDTPPGRNRVAGTILSQTYSGNLMYVTVSVSGGTEILMEAKPNSEIGAIGSPVTIGWSPDETIVLPG